MEEGSIAKLKTIETAELESESSVDWNSSVGRFTLLQKAVENCDADMVRFLAVDKGADPNMVTAGTDIV